MQCAALSVVVTAAASATAFMHFISLSKRKFPFLVVGWALYTIVSAECRVAKKLI